MKLKEEIEKIILKYYHQERIKKLRLATEINSLVLSNLYATDELLNLFKSYHKDIIKEIKEKMPEKREDMEAPDESNYKGEQYVRETIARENHNAVIGEVLSVLADLSAE